MNDDLRAAERLTKTEREQIRSSIDAVAIAANPLTCRAILALLNERDELAAGLQQIEEMTWGGKGESAVHLIATTALSGSASLAAESEAPLDEAAFRRLTGCNGSWLAISDGFELYYSTKGVVELMHNDADVWLPLPHIVTVGDLSVWYLKTTGKELPGLGAELPGKEMP